NPNTMKRILFLLVVALITLGVLLFIFNPEVLEKVWLWLVGLTGVIVATIKKGIDWIKNLTDKKSTSEPKSEESQRDEKQISDLQNQWQTEKLKLTTRIEDLESHILLQEKSHDDFEGTTITLLRYVDDEETTLGLLFYDGKFFCYTLEDTFRETKITGKTRIPKGTYRLGFNKSLT